MNRRKLFSFLAVSPVAALGAVARAKEPTEISVDRIELGAFEIAVGQDLLVIQHKTREGCSLKLCTPEALLSVIAEK